MGTTDHSHIANVQFQDNERSFVIQLISEINTYLQSRDICIKRAGGERTINGGHFVKFPDVLLFPICPSRLSCRAGKQNARMFLSMTRLL